MYQCQEITSRVCIWGGWENRWALDVSMAFRMFTAMSQPYHLSNNRWLVPASQSAVKDSRLCLSPNSSINGKIQSQTLSNSWHVYYHLFKSLPIQALANIHKTYIYINIYIISMRSSTCHVKILVCKLAATLDTNHVLCICNNSP